MVEIPATTGQGEEEKPEVVAKEVHLSVATKLVESLYLFKAPLGLVKPL